MIQLRKSGNILKLKFYLLIYSINNYIYVNIYFF